MTAGAPRGPAEVSPAISIELIRGDRALDRLDDSAFVADWDRLHAACPWASAFQSSAFVDCWYRLHAELFEPIIVEGRDSGGTLVGLLTLARRRTGRTIVGAGDIHAEYQGWIADEGGSGRFMLPALDRLEGAMPDGRVQFKYLPPATPVAWARTPARWPPRVRVMDRLRGTIDLSDPAAIEASLRKGHNRSRLNGLRRYGEVHLETLDSVDVLAADIDQIAILCDLRQGAVNDSLPFMSNPLKRPFHLALMARGLLYTTILRVDGRIASAHMDMKDRDEVLIYLIAHAPEFARQSPGSLHILMLAQALSEQGVARFDLSPGGGYKERFATRQDTIHRMEIPFGTSGRLTADIRHRGITIATGVLAATGRSPHSAQLEAGRLRARIAERVMRQTSRGDGDDPMTIVRLSQGIDRPSAAAQPILAQDQLGDLLAYDPDRSTGPSRHRFLQLALHRLGVGHHVLTRVDDSTLATCWWIARTDPAPKGGAARSRDLSNAANLVVYDPMIAFQLDGATMPDDLGRLRATVDQIAPKATVRVVVPAGMTAVVDDFVAHGAERVAGTEADDVLAAIRVGWPSEDRGGS